MNLKNIRNITSGQIFKDEPMARHTTFRVGGPADYYIVPRTQKELAGLIRYHNSNGLKYIITGNGSNLLVSDAGFRGSVINIGSVDDTEFTLLGYEWEGSELVMDVGAGTLMSSLGRLAAKLGAGGFERLAGIPGCIGGACIMNAGAYESEIKDIVRSVTAIDKNGRVKTLTNAEAGFRYRGSLLMDEGYTVSRVEIVLHEAEAEAVLKETEKYMNERRAKQPLEYPSAGSTFKRPEGYFAGKLISDAGLKGFSIGGAQVSEKHAGFIINTGNASAADIYALIKHVQKEVKDRYSVELIPEIKFVGEFE